MGNIVSFGHTLGYIVVGFCALLLVILGVVKAVNGIRNRNMYKGK